MERNVEMNEVIFIEENIYQKMKKELNKKDDWFNKEELEKFNAISK